jgi:hypothetical protein
MEDGPARRFYIGSGLKLTIEGGIHLVDWPQLDSRLVSPFGSSHGIDPLSSLVASRGYDSKQNGLRFSRR